MTVLPVVPARVHSQKQQETVAVTAANVHTHGRKHSFRGFSTHSLSSLTSGSLGQQKQQGLARHGSSGLSKRSLFAFGGGGNGAATTTTTVVRAGDKEVISVTTTPIVPSTATTTTTTTTTLASRPPSLITDDSSLASISSRSASPEPITLAPITSVSRLEAAFKTYSQSFNVGILQTQLLPVLARSNAHAHAQAQAHPQAASHISKQAPPPLTLDEIDVAFLFKWWHHLLLLSPPHPTVFVCVWALASHPTLLKASLWPAHYALTLSTLLAQDATILPTVPFARLLALGYLMHAPTYKTLRARFMTPASERLSYLASETPSSTSNNDAPDEAWCKRVRQVDVFCEFLRQIFIQRPAHDDTDDVLAERLQQIMTKVLAVRTPTPNTRLAHLGRILGNVDGRLANLVELCLRNVAARTRAFEAAAVFHLLDLLSLLRIKQVAFWTLVLERALDTENHILQIRVFAYLYEHWPLFASHAPATALLLGSTRWQRYFVHWSGIVRDHYMRLLCYRLAVTHPTQVRRLLKRTFVTSLGEHCQLRDCLPGNPIPNKRFAIRPCLAAPAPGQSQLAGRPLALFSRAEQHGKSITTASSSSSLPGPLPPSPPQQTSATMTTAGQVLDGAAAQFVKRKLGLFRGLWEDTSATATATTTTTINTATRQATAPPSPPRQEDEEVDVDEAEEDEMEARRDLAVLGGGMATLTLTPPHASRSLRSITSRGSPLQQTSASAPVPACHVQQQQQQQQPRFKFVAEFVGKQWSLTGDADAIRFLDGVMDLAQHGRLPAFVDVSACAQDASTLTDQEEEEEAFALGEGRKRLWTRSLSEWSVLLDDQERFWRSRQVVDPHSPGASSAAATMAGVLPATVIMPRLEVEFPRWFCQKSALLRGDGVEPQLRR